MSTGSSGKPPGGSQPGRPAADTPQRLVVRSLDSQNDTGMGANDTAVAYATKPGGEHQTSQSGESLAGMPTPSMGTAAIPNELIGSTLSGRYHVTRKVGQGGMGAVYEATHTLIGKKVAIKVLLEKYARREAIVQRLVQEAQLASSIRNEHIIDITDSGTTEDGRTFMVMEFLEGESLAECLARETKLPEQRILRIASQASFALAAAHAKGIVHRDIKPENLFLQPRKEQDFVKVVDFGISKSLRASEEEDAPRLTQTGMVLGTPLYMSPEQARGDDELDARVDIYALGVIMYEAATGRVPFAGNNYLSVISQVLNEEPTPIREIRPEISDEFESVVLRAMAKNKADRYPSANDMLADVTALLDDPKHSTERAKITGPRRKQTTQPRGGTKILVWVAGIAIVVAAIVFSVTNLMGSSSKPGRGTGSAAVVAPQVPIDAAVIAPPIDGPPIPEAELVEVTFDSTPEGAVVFLDGIEKGTTPFTMKVVKKDKEVKGIGQLAGFDDQQISFNPLELPATKKVSFKLKKPPKGTPAVHKTIPKVEDKGSGSGDRPHDKTGGEFSGNPFAGSGTVPDKK
jgi:serine/threonine protein kinase